MYSQTVHHKKGVMFDMLQSSENKGSWRAFKFQCNKHLVKVKVKGVMYWFHSVTV